MKRQIRIPILPLHLFVGATPTDEVFVYKGGKLQKQGRGLTTWCGPRTNIAVIPTTQQKKAYQFVLVSSDGQDFTVAGEITYVINPDVAISKYNFAVDTFSGVPITDAIREAGESTVNALRPHFLKFGAGKAIKELNAARHELEQNIQEVVQTMSQTGAAVTIIQVSVAQSSPATNIAQALQATVREQLLTEADKALALRQTEAETSRRAQLLQKVETDKLHEAARSGAIDAKLANDKKEAVAFGANELEKLKPFENMSPAMVLAHALRTQPLGEIHLTSEFFSLLDSLPAKKPIQPDLPK